MSRQSNAYILVFAAIMTLIVGGSLSGASVLLKDRQKEAERLDQQKQILASVMDISDVENIGALYAERIEAYVVDINGDRVEGQDASKVDVRKEFKDKKDPAERLYPVYEFKNESGQVAAYILPVYGSGLWDNIWGFVALDTDMNTILGITLDHAGETPGLGARITTPEVQERFQGKQVFNAEGQVEAVTMLKGESNPIPEDDKHRVNGMSGATITGNGVSNMLQAYFSHYAGFLKKGMQASAPQESIDQLATANE